MISLVGVLTRCTYCLWLQDINIAIMSYMKTLRITLKTIKGFIDEQKLKGCMDKAVEVIFEAAMEISEMPIKN